MFEKIKRRSLRKLTEKNLSQRDTSQLNAPLKTLGFIVDEVVFQDFEKLYEFWKELDIQRNDVHVFSFIELKGKAPTLRQNQINYKDFSVKGEITNKNAIEFLDREFDVLVGYYEGEHEFLDLLISRSKAKFKVGMADADVRLYDLLIDIRISNPDEFRSELKKYLQILNKI